MLAEKRAKILTAACVMATPLFFAAWSSAQQATTPFSDNFNNGWTASRANSTPNGIWQFVGSNAVTTATETNGASAGNNHITLSAQSGGAGDAYPFSEISTTANQSAFNFFNQPIVLSVSGLNYNAGTTSNALTEFNFGSNALSQTLRTGNNLPPPYNTEYDEPSDFSLEICPPSAVNNTPDNGMLIMGEKQNYIEHSSPWDSYQFIGPIGQVVNGAQAFNGGQVRGFDLVIASGFYYLNVYSDASATDTSQADQVKTTYFARMALNWTPNSGSANSDPVLNIETQLNATTNTTDLASLNIGNLTVSQMPMTWTNGGGDGNWFTPANWSGLSSVINAANAVTDGIATPDYNAANATLPAANGPTQISLANGNGDTITIGTLNIKGTQPYTINGNILQLATGNGTDQINVTDAGNHIINAGLLVYDPQTKINLAAGSSLTINGPVGTGTNVTSAMSIDTTGGAGALNITGDITAGGALTLSSGTGGMTINGGTNDEVLFHGPLTLNVASGGTMAINSFISDPYIAGSTLIGTYPLSKTGGGLATVTSLFSIPTVTVSGGTLRIIPSSTANNFAQGGSYINALSLSGGKLDMTNNDMVIDYTGSSPLQTIKGYLHAGTLFSSTASLALGTTIGYAEATEIGQTSAFNQIPTDSTSICTMYTYYGDLNLNGTVTSADYSLMLSGNGSDWFNGDLNDDGVKNADDFALFQLGVAASSRGNINNLPAPEPGVLAMAAIGAAGLVARRRRA